MQILYLRSPAVTGQQLCHALLLTGCHSVMTSWNGVNPSPRKRNCYKREVFARSGASFLSRIVRERNTTLGSNSKCNTADPDGPWYCHASEVESILEHLAEGGSVGQVLAECPDLKRDDLGLASIVLKDVG